MNARLELLYTLLETDRIKLQEQVNQLSIDQLNYAPHGKWSINQILAHVMTAEKLSLQYMNKKILGINETENSGVIEELKMLALKISQRLPFKFKAPKKVVEFTPTQINLQKLTEDWAAVRTDLKSFLEKIADDQVNKKIYKHVVVGPLNVKQALIFFREHFHHHLPQINKLIAQAGT